MAERNTSSVFERMSAALSVLRSGRSADDTRAITPTTLPGSVVGTPGTGMAGLSLVRTANPQEYKPDGATIRALGFNKHPVVHACIRVVADIVAAVPFVVLREKGDYQTRVPDDHPLQRLLDYPGPRMTARAMRARLAVDYLGYGNAMFQMERPAPGRLPLGLRSINPESLQSVWVDQEGDPRRYDYGNWAGVIVQVPVEDVLHFRDLDMPRPFFPDVFGFPRGATAIASMTADNEATSYVRQVVTNDGTPTFAVLLSDEATQDDATAMQDRYRARVVDRGKRGTPAFFGAVRDIKPLGFTLRDLEFPDLRRVSREDICAAYGVDPRMIGIASATSDAGLSGAQYVEARARLVQHTIEPMLTAIEDELNHWLAPEYGDVWVAFDHDVMRDLVEDDTATSTRVQAEFKIGLRTWEESRRALKLSPLPEPTDTIALTTGTQLVPAATAVIDPRAVMDQPPATDNEAPQTGPGPMTTDAGAAAMDVAEAEQGQTDEELGRAADATNFPAKGDNKKVSLRNSQWSVFPVAEAEALKRDFPTIWRKGGNIRGNKQFRLLAPIAKRGGTVDGLSEENAVRLREAWGARHGRNSRVAGVVAQIKWLVVGERGLSFMRSVIAEEKAKLKDRAEARVRAMADEALAGDQIEQLMELLEAIAEGELPTAAVEAVILAAFPKLDTDLVAQMVAAMAEFEPEEEDEGEDMPEDEGEDEDDAEEMPEEPEAEDDLEASAWWERLTPDELEAEPRYQYWRRAMDELNSREEPFAKAARSRFAKERTEVGRMFGLDDRAFKTSEEILAEIQRRIREDYAPGGDYYEAWKRAYLDLIGEMYMVGAKQTGGVGLSFSLQSPEVLAAIDARSARLAELVGETTSTNILSAIRAAELAGLSVAETGRLVQASVFNERITDGRARTIARTESAGAMSQGNWDQAREMGIYQSKEWLAFEDSKTRETHTACMAQGVVPFEATFSNGLMYPLDPVGAADEVINCRCVLATYDTTVEDRA